MDWLRPMLCQLLRCGPVPQHLAFIMDGNRRFAERKAGGDLHEGHSQGFSKLIESLEWCLDLGIKCVTVYAFSIENFNRSKQEVETLMTLAETKLLNLLTEEAELIKKHDLRVCVLGNLALLPVAVQKAAEKVMQATCANQGSILNICLAYLSSQEMAHALQKAAQSPSNNHINSYLYTKDCPPVDLLIRTSGETRLSDFMLWQSQNALLHFTEVLWPDFSFRHFLRALLEYQAFAKTQSVETPNLRKEKQEAETSESLNLPSEHMAQTQGRDPEDSVPNTAESSSKGESNTAQLQIVADSRIVNNDMDPSCSFGLREEELEMGLTSEIPQMSHLRDLAVTAPSRRNTRQNLDRRKRNSRGSIVQLPDGENLEGGMFEKPVEENENRKEDLKRNGFASGYDSMEEDDDDAHVNGCPCCIVKFLPMHRICTDPTPGIKAMRET